MKHTNLLKNPLALATVAVTGLAIIVTPLLVADASASQDSKGFCVVSRYTDSNAIKGTSGACEHLTTETPTPDPTDTPTPDPTPTEEPVVEPVSSKGYTVESRVSPNTSVRSGDILTYTYTIRNTGTEAYTSTRSDSPETAVLRVDLRDLLDDVSGGRHDTSNYTKTSGEIWQWNNGMLWAGSLGAKGTPSDTVTIVYKIRVTDYGNKSAVQKIEATGNGGSCVPTTCSTTTVITD